MVRLRATAGSGRKEAASAPGSRVAALRHGLEDQLADRYIGRQREQQWRRNLAVEADQHGRDGEPAEKSLTSPDRSARPADKGRSVPNRAFIPPMLYFAHPFAWAAFFLVGEER